MVTTNQSSGETTMHGRGTVLARRPAARPSYRSAILMILWSAAIVFAAFGRVSAQDAAVTIAWDRMADHDDTVFYRLWRGIVLLGETKENRLEVRLPTDQISTLHCTAHRGELVSAPSKPLVVAPAVVHRSPDMRVWIVEKSSYFFQTLEREGVKTEREFYRVHYYTPTP